MSNLRAMKRRSLVLFVSAFVIGTSLLGSHVAIADNSTNGAYEVTIPLSNDGLPASDLVYTKSGRSHIMSPQEAWNLKKKSKTDLSMLDPDATSDMWKNLSTAQDDALDDTLPVQSGDTVTFQGFISASPGRFKFNVQVQSAFGPPRTYTVVLSRDIHTTLLRKGLLRRLGYKIPPMKYLKKINVILPDAETHDKTFPAAIANYALGAVKRWQIPAPAGASALTFSLQDVMVMEATPLYYNVAMGPPIETVPGTNQIRPEGPRTLRALGPVYGLANIPENIHQSAWNVGRVEDGQIVIDVNDRANFACTMDDALWITRRIAKLSRADYEAIVAKAYYPDFVAKLVVENLIARRNSLFDTLGFDVADISYDAKISYGTQLVNGKLVDQDWQALGYAADFSGIEPQSPLKDIWWYVVSQIQSNLTANLLEKINNSLPQLAVDEAINQHNEKLYNDALEQYLKDGSQQTVHFGAWAAPVASGGVDISRDIVIGSYMGTTGENGASNIVQLADNFGFHVSAGLYIGFDGLPVNPLPVNLQGQVMGSASIAVTHLKPITSLKAAVKEPLKNEFVPWIFYKASSIMDDVAAVQHATGQTPDQIKQKIAANLDALKDFIGTGESLILTESMALNESLQLGTQAPAPLSPSIGVQPGANQVLLWRLRIYRPENNPSMLMIYKDNGSLQGLQVSINLSVGAPASLPVVTMTAKGVAGSADTEYYRVNVSPDPQKNPQIYSNSAALAVALRGGSIEALKEIQKPTLVSTKFHDTSDTFQFLYYVDRSLKTNGVVTVSLPNGVSDSFISLSDGNQKGGNYQSLGTQIVNYIIQKYSTNPDVTFDTKAAQNPGQTFKGYSSTRDASLQARAGNDISEMFGKVQYRWEGWDISQPDIQALVDSLSKKYGFALYPSGFMHDTEEVQLYSISLSLNFYESALKNILSMSPSAEERLVSRYRDLHHCYAQQNSDADPTAPTPDQNECRAIFYFDAGYGLYHPETRGWLTTLLAKLGVIDDGKKLGELYQTYWKGSATSVAEAEAVLNIFTNLEQFVSFDELVEMSGGRDSTGQPKNMYLQSMISGFRVGSENLSQPISSNTLGHINPDQRGGPLDSAQQILGIDDGEFEAQWVRDHL